MLLSLASLALAATQAMAAAIRSSEAHEWCGTSRPTLDNQNQARIMAEQALEGFSVQSNIVVDTYFHCVTSSTSPDDGWLSDEVLQAQLDVMNDNFGPSGISFSLKEVTRTVNTNWSTNGMELEMKKALRQGSYGALNIYFLTSLGGGLLGYATFPDHFETGSDDFYLDGLVILHSTVPGGAATNFDEGKTATHEAGHWFYLFHTFEGGCDGDGDFIDDTPAQSSPTSGCPVGRDSCPAAGLDPIHNYMDYSYDSCYDNFTPDQTTRMKAAFAEFRS